MTRFVNGSLVGLVLALVPAAAIAQEAPPAETPAPQPAPETPADAPEADGPAAPEADAPAAPESAPASPEAAPDAAAPGAAPTATVTPAAPAPEATPATPAPEATPARVAVEAAAPPPPEDDLPIPTLTIDRIPPNTSFEFAVSASFGEVAYFQDVMNPWIGFGVRGGWGKNFGKHRLGFAATATAEGDVLIHTQLGLQPELAWDFVSGKGVLLGAGVGPALIWTAENVSIESEYGVELSPTAAARIGWSQTWSRVGRRLFVYVEPKVRLVGADVSPLVAVAVGSGSGR